MFKTLIGIATVAAILPFIAGPLGIAQTQSGAPNDDQAIRAAVTAYADAFNKGDLAGLSAVWAPDAEYIDEAGNVTKGRDNIAALFKQFVTDRKGSKMDLKVTSLRMLKGDVAMQDGVATITGPDGAADEGRYTAVWFKNDGKWQIRSARDLPYDAADTPGAGGALKELAWMVGEWEGEKGGVTVSTRWALNKTFLQQDYVIKSGQGETSIMQLVGFDPLTGQIKSWTFDSLGGYGEGLWERDGNAWTVQTAGVLPGGQTGTAVNVIRFVDDNNATFQSRDRDVGGQPIPDAEVKLARKAAKK